MANKRQNSFLKYLVHVIIRKVILRICGIVRFLTTQQETFLSRICGIMRFLYYHYTLLGSSCDIVYTSSFGFHNQNVNNHPVRVVMYIRYCSLLITMPVYCIRHPAVRGIHVIRQYTLLAVISAFCNHVYFYGIGKRLERFIYHFESLF